MSIYGGYFLSSVFGYGSSFFGTVYGLEISGLFVEFLPGFYKTLPLLCSIIGFIGSIVFFNRFPNIFLSREVFWFFVNRWYIDTLVNRFLVRPFFSFGYTIMEVVDKRRRYSTKS